MSKSCPEDNTAVIDQSSFWTSNGLNWDAHRIGWVISGACASVVRHVFVLLGIRRAKPFFIYLTSPILFRQCFSLWSLCCNMLRESSRVVIVMYLWAGFQGGIRSSLGASVRWLCSLFLRGKPGGGNHAGSQCANMVSVRGIPQLDVLPVPPSCFKGPLLLIPNPPPGSDPCLEQRSSLVFPTSFVTLCMHHP